MKTINKKYIDIKDLKEFIDNNNIAENKNILIQIFTGICDVKFIENLLSCIKGSIPHAKIIGSTTSGEILNDNVYNFTTILSFSIFENTQIVTHSQELLKNSYKTAKELISKFDTTKKTKVAISFSDGANTNGETYLRAFYDYDKELIVAGGLAGDNAKFKETIVFTQNEILTKGSVVALLYNDDLIAHTKAIFGWENIGKTLTITKAKENIVYEIDGIKAVDIYTKYLGDDIASELPKTGIEFPLIIKKDGLNIPRATVGRNSDGALVFAGNLNEGDKVSFGYGNIERIIEYGDKSHDDIVKNPIESIFIYSCMARKALLGKSIASELKALNSISTLSGFFTYGEFYSNCKTLNNELLNQTMTILTLSEKKTTTPKVNINNKTRDKKDNNKTLKALSHLITQTTLELEDINNSLSDKIKEEVRKNRIQDQQLLQQSRLAQMGEMLNMIAHQWRQPLAAISSTSAGLELKAALGKADKDTITISAKNISKYSQHLSSTIDDFRNFFKYNKVKEKTTYSEIIKSIFNIIEASIISKRIELILDLNCEDSFLAFPNEIKQVILNLIKNSEDILLEKEIADAYIKIATYNKDDSLILEVSDNGGGIPKDILDKIFDPYFSTKLEKNGTGLGLYMSKTIIEEHCSGKLNAFNSENGAVFRIEFHLG